MAISNRAPTSAFLRCAALRGSLFEVNATLFSAPRIPDPPLFRQGILPPASAQRQRIRPRIPREFVSPESTLFLSPSLVRREVRGASFHPSFFLISFFYFNSKLMINSGRCSLRISLLRSFRDGFQIWQ